MNPPLSHDHPDAANPERDGKPAEDDLNQHAWLVKVKEHMEFLFAQDPGLFATGDLYRSPVPADPDPADAEQSQRGDPPATGPDR